MGRKGSMNLQVITDSFVKDQSRRRNCQALSARIPTTPIKTQQRKLSSPEIELTSSPNKKPEVPALTIQTAPKSAIPKASGPRSGFPTSAVPKSAFPSLRISTLVTSGNKASGPKTPLSASSKKNPGLNLQTPASVIPEIDAPDTPVNVIYANAFFDNKTREDEETQAINKKVLKQQRKENIRNMRRERMKQPKDIRVALILGRLYDASHYELGPLSYWSDPEVENNEELKPKEIESTEETENKPKKMIQLNPDEEIIEIEDEKEKNSSNNINYDKVNNVNAHPAWVPEEAGCNNIACQKTATRINGKLVKKNKKPYVAVASYFAKLYDPVLMKKREEEEKLKLIEKQRQNSIITELKPMGKSINTRNQNNSRQNNNGNNYNNYSNCRSQGSQNHYQNRQNYNKSFNNSTFNNNKFKRDEKANDTFQTNFRENRNQQQPNARSNYYSSKRSPTQTNNYMSNNDYNQTYSYGYVYQYPVYQYYDPNMVPNYNYGTGYNQNYTNSNANNYYFNSSYDNNNQNKFKPRMNYHNNNNNNNNQNSFNNKKSNETFAFKKYEKKVNIKS